MSARKRSRGEPDEARGRPSPRAAEGGAAGAAGEPGAIVWTPGGAQVLLPAGERLLLWGRAALRVHSGAVDVAGRRVSASDGAVPLAGAPEAGGAAALAVASAEAPRVPLASAGGAALSLAGAGAAGGRSFDLALAGAPGAPAAPSPPPDAWRAAAEAVAASAAAGAAAGAPPAAVAVLGAKKVGKSALARLLVNTLLNKFPVVAYLDLDPGQPEHTAPGLASLCLLRAPLAGAPHARLRAPDAAYFLGDLSPAADPGRALAATIGLRAWWLRRGGGAPGAPPPPLVVNTHGWVRGAGLDALAAALRALSLTHAVRLAAANPKRDLPPGPFWLEEGAGGGAAAPPPPPPLQWEVPGAGGAANAGDGRDGSPEPSPGGGGGGGGGGPPSAGRAAPAPSAVDQRALQWAAFAEACVAASAEGAGGGAAAGAGGAEALADRLAAAAPWEVSLDAVRVAPLHAAVPPAELLRALNGAVVGLCAGGGAGGAPPPCVGLGLVRAADGAARRLLVLTDAPAARLAAVDRLELGRLELPAALLRGAAAAAPHLALFSLGAAGTGAGAARARNNLARGGQR
jgi:polynucleotide 5'-hydroxyl-kinase GRC3/NOL9